MLGFSDWLTGTNCAECGRKIQGTRFARTVMGTSVWVCSACNEKQQEERRLETERNVAAAEERRLENFAAQQKRFAEAAAAIQQRSDKDIAEGMSTIILRQYGTLNKKVRDATGGNAEFNHQAAFMYFLAVSTYAFRRFLGLQLDSARLDRIEETAGRYALEAAPVTRSLLFPFWRLAPTLARRKLLWRHLANGFSRPAFWCEILQVGWR